MMTEQKPRELSVNIRTLIDEWITEKDWRVHENSNMNRSFQALVLHVSGEVISKYVLDKYPQRIRKRHLEGYYHIHNLTHGLVPYCGGWSLRDLLMQGILNPSFAIRASPPKHMDTAALQIVNFLGILQLEYAGAQAFSSLDTYLAPFVYYDHLSYKQVKQTMQKIVYGLNVPSRWGCQTPFTNFTFDIVPTDLAGEHVIVGGEIKDRTYEEFQEEIMMINRAFLEIMLEGDAEGKPFTFPIPTYNLTRDMDWNTEIMDLLFELTAKYGTPYFQNYIGSDLDPHSIRAMCCRLQLDLKQLMSRGNGLFGSGELTGSIGVVTINMNRIGYLARGDDDKFFEILDMLMDDAKEALEFKRKLLEFNMRAGLLPYTRLYLGRFNTYFSTIGLIGMNEGLLNFMGKTILDREGQKFAIKVLDHMRSRIVKYQEETGNLYNLEATPGEGASYRLALLDRKMYSDIITAGDADPYLTNSTWIPASLQPVDIFDALENQEPLQVRYTGGTTFRVFLGEAISKDGARALVKKIATKSKIPYFDITPTYSICKHHGYIPGEHFVCPHCGDSCLVYSRVVGYYRPVQNWNPGKKEEFRERRYFEWSG